MIHDAIKFSGRLAICLYGPDGEIKASRDIPNLVVTGGKTFIAARMVAATAAVMSHMAIGSGTVAAALADTALGTSVVRVALASGTSAGAVATYVASYPAGVGTGAITEAGIFNDPAVGTMLCRTVFAVINKGAADTMSITWTVTAT